MSDLEVMKVGYTRHDLGELGDLDEYDEMMGKQQEDSPNANGLPPDWNLYTASHCRWASSL